MRVSFPGTSAHTYTARRRGSALPASFIPGLQREGKMCATFPKAGPRTACIDLINRNAAF